MQPHPLAGLKLMVAGLSAAASRDVIRSLLSAAADVACVGDEADTTQLQRDLGLYGLTARTLPVDLGSLSEMRLFAANLQACEDLPHIVVCCCSDGEHCPSSLLSALLSPPLFLHLITRDCAPVVGRLLDLGTRDLQSIIRRRLVFGGGAPIRRAMIGRNTFALQRRNLGRPVVRLSASGRGRPPPHRDSRVTPRSAIRRPAQKPWKRPMTTIFIENVLGSGQIVTVAETFKKLTVECTLRPGESGRFLISPFKSIVVNEHMIAANSSDDTKHDASLLSYASNILAK